MKHRPDMQTKEVSQKPAKQPEETPSSKEMIMLGTGLLFLTLSFGGMLMISEDEPLQANAAKPADMKKVSQAFHSQTPTALPAADFVSEPPTATLVSLKQNDLSSESTTDPNEVDIYFDFDKTLLSEDAKAIIQQTVDSYKDREEWSVTVQGHADQKGADTYNQSLGLRRADAVKTYLTSHGIDESLIRIESFGSSSNVCTEDTEDCFQKNRRAHLIISTDPQSASVDLPRTPRIAEVEEEHTATEETEVVVAPLSEEDAPTTTALLSEAMEEIPRIESIAATTPTP